MTDESIRKIVKETISELKRQGLIREDPTAEVAQILSDYYQEGLIDSQITEVLNQLHGDPYYKIIPLYYDYGETWERIAEHFGVERSTIFRNKKRLYLLIYKALQKGE